MRWSFEIADRDVAKVGWKTQTILIRPAELNGGPETLLVALGHDRPSKISETSFSDAGAGSVWIGAIADCVIIYTHLASGFFDDGADRAVSDFRSALLQHFPQSEVAALFLHSVVGAWEFEVHQRGTLIRHQHGYDDIVQRDEGPKLPAEEDFLARFERHDIDGHVRYRDPARPDLGDMSDPDFGEQLVFEICRSFTGYPLDQLDDLKGADFWLSEEEKQEYESRRPRPWRKFWS